jgi:hypothetical protein
MALQKVDRNLLWCDLINSDMCLSVHVTFESRYWYFLSSVSMIIKENADFTVIMFNLLNPSGFFMYNQV